MYPYSRRASEVILSRQWVVTLRLQSGKVVCNYPYANNRSQAIAVATVYTEKPEVLSAVPYRR
jgi:hypothetical protein